MNWMKRLNQNERTYDLIDQFSFSAPSHKSEFVVLPNHDFAHIKIKSLALYQKNSGNYFDI